ANIASQALIVPGRSEIVVDHSYKRDSCEIRAALLLSARGMTHLEVTTMGKSDEIVFAPSIDWAKRKAKLLRKRIGPGSITHTV
ncbi:hypothetical protein, partial [Paraburkholderia sp. SIMBA_030]|uniref:hypothetical protein n=1 Tax=Paraburkholderia sp. SIMBA_030 TaxID=3085773 RepID=UPI003978497B